MLVETGTSRLLVETGTSRFWSQPELDIPDPLVGAAVRP